MASVRVYLEKMTTGQLEYFLERELSGWGEYNMDTLYLICTILSERDSEHDAPRDYFLRFCEAFADKKEDL